MRRSELLKAQIQESRINGDVSAEHLEWLAEQYEIAKEWEKTQASHDELEPYDVLQVMRLDTPNGLVKWQDFSTLRTAEDFSIARRLVSGEPVNGFVGTFRVIRPANLYNVVIGPEE